MIDTREGKLALHSISIGTYTVRLGEYIRAFGLSGLRMSVEHLLKYKIKRSKVPLKTVVPHFGSIWLRPASSDLATFREIFVTGEYNVRRAGAADALRKRYNDILSSGRRPLIIDAGANIGLATRYFLHYFPFCDVLLVEPDEDNAEIARLNCLQFPSASVVRAALWTSAGMVRLSRSPNDSTHTVTEDCTDLTKPVRSVTLNELVSGREIDLLILKMDIEGSEKAILGDGTVCSTCAPIIMVEPHDGGLNDYGSLAGLLSIDDYKKGMILTSTSVITFVPQSALSSNSQ